MTDVSCPTAAIYYVPEGYSTSGAALMGINVASEGALRALARYGGMDTLYAFTETAENAHAFDQAVRNFNPAMATQWIPTVEVGRLPAVGTVLLPGPGLGGFGWMRRRAGRSAYSLCGITHTTATPVVLDALVDLLTAPVYPWDALICTSRAVHGMVSTVLADQQAYLEDRFGARDIPRPMLPIIPLGVECDDFESDPPLRQIRRDQLGLTDDDVVFLWVGRLSHHAKANPLPLFDAIEMAAGRTSRRLHLAMAGWFVNAPTEQAYRSAAESRCPNVAIHFVDARERGIRAEIWQLADVFVSPVDNVQETFGLTPIEAMAAGLPVIVSDWNGYRDSVRDGVDGFCIPTTAVPPGVCAELGLRYGARIDGYDTYIGQASQCVMVDVAAFAEAASLLANDSARRRSMGEKGRARARALYDWRRIVPRYQQLWTELGRMRGSGGTPEFPIYPSRPDPFHAFETYPSRIATPDLRVQAVVPPPGVVADFLYSPFANFAQSILPSAEELADLLMRSSGDGQTVRDLLESIADDRRRTLWRGIVWLGKFGFVRLR